MQNNISATFLQSNWDDSFLKFLKFGKMSYGHTLRTVVQISILLFVLNKNARTIMFPHAVYTNTNFLPAAQRQGEVMDKVF